MNRISSKLQKIEGLKLSPYFGQLISVVKELRNEYDCASVLLDNVILVNSIEDNNINLKCSLWKVDDVVKEGLKSVTKEVSE